MLSQVYICICTLETINSFIKSEWHFPPMQNVKKSSCCEAILTKSEPILTYCSKEKRGKTSSHLWDWKTDAFVFLKKKTVRLGYPSFMTWPIWVNYMIKYLKRFSKLVEKPKINVWLECVTGNQGLRMARSGFACPNLFVINTHW